MSVTELVFQSCAVVGALYLATLSYSFLQTCFSFGTYKFKPTDGEWAVVTGASDGIGKEFALQLAKKKYNVVLLARSNDKLTAIGDEIKKLGQEALVFVFDFSTKDDQLWKALQMKLNSLQVGVLVNNVGVSHDFPVSFLDEDQKKIDQIMTVNVHSLMKITRIVLPQMVERKKGLVLNIGSMAGKVPSPLLAVYGASKSFVSAWSQGLSREVNKANVHVEHINTYFVQTAMSKIRKSSLMVPTPRAFAKSVLSNCGSKYDTTPYFTHALIDWVLTSFVPEQFKIEQSGKMHVDIRKRALKKLEREAASKK
ncbi:hypothetical protein BC833DRAFT_59611 [Globomyces pollinis-pini]|nr:hypothetical protein BC833DRAFT_59611 [Globomyces pollinis-pini]